MSRPVLVIGNKNYSSWSLRPWLALRAAGVDFDEEMIVLDQADTAERIAAHSGAGKVPVLYHGALRIWESLAICEYVAEQWPDARLWPEERQARATARAMSAEMHAAFPALREECWMHLRRKAPKELSAAARRDISRVCDLWRLARSRHAHEGPYLFGHFTIADCMYAPVVTRFVSYEVGVDDVCAAYRDAILEHPAMQDWYAAAATEALLPEHG